MKYRWKKRLLTGIGMIICLILLILCSFRLITAVGKHRIQSGTASWQEGLIKYQGKVYQYNDEIMTFLIMGIDKGTEAIEGYEDEGYGQADALFLAVLNPKNKSIQIIGINRNSMTDIDIYDETGSYMGTTTAQIAVQHGFGDGREISCQYQLNAVRNLLYHIPIHKYAAVQVSAIPAINDAVGGVDVAVLQDLTCKNPLLTKGSQVHLLGESAYWYVKYRDTSVFGSADMRLARQKQYLSSFVAQAKLAVTNDASVVLDLYQALMPQVVTNISIDEIAYLASILPDYHFSEDGIHTLDGETIMGETFEEFYPDETALYELILDIFYEEVSVDKNAKARNENAYYDEASLSAYIKENPDVFGWLEIPGTEINCPVLQSGISDSFYRTHDASGVESSGGAVYIESANLTSMCDFNTVFYGNAEIGPFTDLYEFTDPVFFEEHPRIYLYLEDNVLTYEIFAAYRRENTNLLRSYDFTVPDGCRQFLKDLYDVREMGSNLREGWEGIGDCHFLITLTAQSSEETDTQWVVAAVLTKDESGTIQKIVWE